VVKDPDVDWLERTWRTTRAIKRTCTCSFSAPFPTLSLPCTWVPGLPKHWLSLSVYWFVPAAQDHGCSWMWFLFCEWKHKKVIENIIRKNFKNS